MTICGPRSSKSQLISTTKNETAASLSHRNRTGYYYLIPKPSDPIAEPSAALVPPVTLRPLGLPEIFYRLAGRAAVKLEGPLVGPTMEPVQLGVGIPSGCQIGARGAQCAFDAKQAVSAYFRRHQRLQYGGSPVYLRSHAPRMLRYYHPKRYPTWLGG